MFPNRTPLAASVARSAYGAGGGFVSTRTTTFWRLPIARSAVRSASPSIAKTYPVMTPCWPKMLTLPLVEDAA